MLITVCGCDVLKCKAHLNPAANYRMFRGGVSTAEVGLGLSRGLKHKNWHQLNAKYVITGGKEGGEGEKGRVYSAMHNCINNRFHIGESSTSKGVTRRWEGFRSRCRPCTFPLSAFPTAFHKNALYSFCTPLNK